MSKSNMVELDFFGMEKQNASKQTSSIRGWQRAISRINPQLVNKVLAASEAQKATSYNWTTPKSDNLILPETPPLSPKAGEEATKRFLVTPTSRSTTSDVTAPLTIFYNGSVNVFDVSHDKAEVIIKLAETEVVGVAPLERPSNPSSVLVKSQEELLLLEKLQGADLPIARKKSLRSFLEKRKERLTSVWPYPTTSTTSMSPYFSSCPTTATLAHKRPNFVAAGKLPRCF